MISLKPKKLIFIGASTGGPGLIEQIITALKFPIEGSIIIAQHMQREHLHSFAERLGRIGNIPVQFAIHATQIENGRIYVLGDTVHLVEKNNRIIIEEITKKGFYHPTIDELFFSAAALRDVIKIAYLLSGIGADGAKGLLSLKSAGYKTVAQDAASSIVYGMPKNAYEIGAATYVMSILEIVEDICRELQDV